MIIIMLHIVNSMDRDVYINLLPYTYYNYVLILPQQNSEVGIFFFFLQGQQGRCQGTDWNSQGILPSANLIIYLTQECLETTQLLMQVASRVIPLESPHSQIHSYAQIILALYHTCIFFILTKQPQTPPPHTVIWFANKAFHESAISLTLITFIHYYIKEV